MFDYSDTYKAMASDGRTAVWNCYGSTPEAAKEMALCRLQQVYFEEERHHQIVRADK